MENKRKIGATYEKVATEYLIRQGYEILALNYRCFLGEIDIVARDNDTIVFCEVKYRKTKRMGTPLEAVGIRKQQVIMKSAMCFLNQYKLSKAPCRFDVIGIEGEEIAHVKNAFDGS